MHNSELNSYLLNNINDSSSDSDICDYSEICRIFNQANSVCEKVISKNNYILSIDATSENEPNIAVALSENSCEIHKLSNQQVATLAILSECKDRIFDCKFSKQDNNLIYTSSRNGSITLWDIRTPNKSVISFLDTTVKNGTSKIFCCFDISSNERLLTAGTELFDGDAFLLFWDIRKNQLLGGYWESHTDDVTQVKFDPENKDRLMSGSTDGLINIYDLSQSCEDDAVIDSLNTQSSVDQLLWFNEKGKCNISCITHTSDLQLWSLDGAKPYKHFTRADISKGLKKKNEEFIYIANVHSAANDMLVLTGSNYKDGACLRCLQIKCEELQPAYSFENNKQHVRSSWFNPHTNVLLTGGEKGILNVWNLKYKN